MTNALKAAIIAALNAGLGVAVAFGLPLSQTQMGAILVFANAVLAIVALATRKNSPRWSDG